MRRSRCLLLALLLCALPAVRAEEPFFKKGDVIALVGGEDMVALSEYGYLELLLTRALPDYHLRFRNLAWEGDTVFEQRRDLNFPPWEEQLEKIGATVIICQFGQMESLAGKEKLPEFIAAYEKLLARFSGGGKRRVVIITPVIFPGAAEDQVRTIPETAEVVRPFVGSVSFAEAMSTKGNWLDASFAYGQAITDFAARGNWCVVTLMSGMGKISGMFTQIPRQPQRLTRDGVHLGELGHRFAGLAIVKSLCPSVTEKTDLAFSSRRQEVSEAISKLSDNPLRQLIIAKNRLWFDYWRVQNWAFLAGDRTNQPSSRDHLDPAKRWFPEERERFLPLIEAKEKEIDALAAQLAKP